MGQFFISFFAFSISHRCLLNFWEGDKVFFPLSASSPKFCLALSLKSSQYAVDDADDELRTCEQKAIILQAARETGRAIFLSANFVSVPYLVGIHSSAAKPISVEFPIFFCSIVSHFLLGSPHPDVFWRKLFYCRWRSGIRMINEKPNVTEWHEFFLPPSLLSDGERNFPINSLPISIPLPQPVELENSSLTLKFSPYHRFAGAKEARHEGKTSGDATMSLSLHANNEHFSFKKLFSSRFAQH